MPEDSAILDRLFAQSDSDSEDSEGGTKSIGPPVC